MFNATEFSNAINRFYGSFKGDAELKPEVELRYRSVEGNILKPLDNRKWLRTLSHYQLIQPNVKSISTVDKIYSFTKVGQITKKLIISTNVSEDVQSTEYRYKIAIDSFKPQDNLNYGTRLSFAVEQTLDKQNDEVIKVINSKSIPYVRNKTRWSFDLGCCRLDMTKVDASIVSQTDDNVKMNEFVPEQTFEIELELTDETKIDLFLKKIRELWLTVNDSLILYTFNERSNAIREINHILSSDLNGASIPQVLSSSIAMSFDSQRIDDRKLANARNLHMKDMKYGGLICNTPKDEIYTVTHKADGVRKLIYINDTGLWLIMAGEASLVIRADFEGAKHYVLDGEYIPKNQRLQGAPKTSIWYLIFDCISTSTYGRAIQSKSHRDRMLASQECANIINKVLAKININAPQKNVLSAITINTKTFKSVNSVGNSQVFFDVMRQMFDEQLTLPYKNDGFMFTPNSSPYYFKAETSIFKNNQNIEQKTPIERYDIISSERILTRYPDICKWKPLEMMTMDLEVIWIATPQGSSFKLYGGAGKDKLIEFTGTTYNPFNISMVGVGKDTHTDNILSTIKDTKSIVEWGWSPSLNKLVAHRIRSDKLRPNKIEIAMDVWDIVCKNEMTKETLLGDTFSFVRRYHNMIKNEVFNKYGIEDTIGVSGRKNILLDIGSGRGGDISKWLKNFDYVIAVEPNEEHILEMKRRLQGYGEEAVSRVKIVNCGGEDIDTITNAMEGYKADVVSMMLSLSFFWNLEEPTLLTRLATVIATNVKSDGKMIFLTQDGRALSELFRPTLRGFGLKGVYFSPRGNQTFDNNREEIDLGVSKIKLNGNVVDIHISDSIVENQREYLVYIYDLVLQLNIVLTSETQARLLTFKNTYGYDQFLTTKERVYTQLYAWGAIQFEPVSVYKQEMLKKIPVIENMSTSYDIINVTAPSEDKMDSVQAINDDVVQPIFVSNNSNVQCYRISCIQDDSSFIHALLKASFGEYQDATNYLDRISICIDIRNELGEELEYNNEQEKYAKFGPDASVYRTALDGFFFDSVQKVLSQIKDSGKHTETDENGKPIIYTRFVVQSAVNGTQDYEGVPMSGKIRDYISDQLPNVVVYYVKATSDGLLKLGHSYVHPSQNIRNMNFIILNTNNNMTKFEVIGRKETVDKKPVIMTYFPAQDRMRDFVE
jgi:hypothetical protein